MCEDELKYISFMKSEGKALRGARNKLEGATPEFLAELERTNPQMLFKSKDMFEYIIPVKNGEVIHTKYHDLKLIEVPGHTVGNSMFWIEKEKITFILINKKKRFSCNYSAVLGFQKK